MSAMAVHNFLLGLCIAQRSAHASFHNVASVAG